MSKPESFDPVLERARAKVLDWARSPETEKEHFSFGRLSSAAPFSGAVFLSIMDRIEQLKNADLRPVKEIKDKYKPQEENLLREIKKLRDDRLKRDKEADLLKLQKQKEKEISKIKDIDPRLFELDPAVESPIAHTFIMKLFSGTAGVAGKRAEKLLETVKDMSRPSGGLGAWFGNLMGNKDQELEQIEEVPKFE